MITSIISLLIFALIFAAPMAKASQSEDNSTRSTSTVFNEATNTSDQNDEAKDIVQEKDDDIDSPSSPELSLSLNDHLQWFFSVERPDFAVDPYENKDYDNYRATFGFQFAL